jgi:hypothetical protein
VITGFCRCINEIYAFVRCADVSRKSYLKCSNSPRRLLRTLKANSHTYHAVPLPCRAAKGLDYVFTILFTQCGRVLFTCHAAPVPCNDHAVLIARPEAAAFAATSLKVTPRSGTVVTRVDWTGSRRAPSTVW